MAKVLKLTCDFVPKNGWMWQIKNLPYWDWFEKREYPNTKFPLVGMYHSCDTPESVVAGVYRAIYDYHQVAELGYGFHDGDVIESDPVTVNKYHHYDEKLGKIDIPAMRFKVVSYHVVQELPENNDK